MLKQLDRIAFQIKERSLEVAVKWQQYRTPANPSQEHLQVITFYDIEDKDDLHRSFSQDNSGKPKS